MKAKSRRTTFTTSERVQWYRHQDNQRVDPDVHRNVRKYERTLARLNSDQSILDSNRNSIRKFLDEKEAAERSIARLLNCANHLIEIESVSGRKKFEEMCMEEVTRIFLRLKMRNKKATGWEFNGGNLSEGTLNDYRIIISLFWKWLKGRTGPSRSTLWRSIASADAPPEIYEKAFPSKKTWTAPPRPGYAGGATTRTSRLHHTARSAPVLWMRDCAARVWIWG